jgi:hypothetical protein
VTVTAGPGVRSILAQVRSHAHRDASKPIIVAGILRSKLVRADCRRPVVLVIVGRARSDRLFAAGAIIIIPGRICDARYPPCLGNWRLRRMFHSIGLHLLIGKVQMIRANDRIAVPELKVYGIRALSSGVLLTLDDETRHGKLPAVLADNQIGQAAATSRTVGKSNRITRSGNARDDIRSGRTKQIHQRRKGLAVAGHAVLASRHPSELKIGSP